MACGEFDQTGRGNKNQWFYIIWNERSECASGTFTRAWEGKSSDIQQYST